MPNPAKVEKMVEDAKAKGFHVHMALAYTDIDTSLESNQNRERTVPDAIVAEGHEKVTTNWPSYKNIPGVDTVDKRVRKVEPPKPQKGAASTP